MSSKKKSCVSGKQARYLRGLGHHLKPLVLLGREGINKNVITEIDAVLSAHELVKVRVGNGCLLDRKDAAGIAADKTGSEVVQVLGRTFLLYRANPDRKAEHSIKLPG